MNTSDMNDGQARTQQQNISRECGKVRRSDTNDRMNPTDELPLTLQSVNQSRSYRNSTNSSTQPISVLYESYDTTGAAAPTQMSPKIRQKSHVLFRLKPSSSEPEETDNRNIIYNDSNSRSKTVDEGLDNRSKQSNNECSSAIISNTEAIGNAITVNHHHYHHHHHQHNHYIDSSAMGSMPAQNMNRDLSATHMRSPVYGTNDTNHSKPYPTIGADRGEFPLPSKHYFEPRLPKPKIVSQPNRNSSKPLNANHNRCSTQCDRQRVEADSVRKQLFSQTIDRNQMSGSSLDTGIETDPETLKRRQKNIDYGRALPGYQVYLESVPKEERKPEDPVTPDKTQIWRRRVWEKEIKEWKGKIHRFDPSEPLV